MNLTPDLSTATVLRPYKRFEYDYGKAGGPVVSGAVPIAFSWPPNPNDVSPPSTFDTYAYDPASREGIVGYDPHLMKMVPCPIGSDMLLYLPFLPNVDSAVPLIFVWKVLFRLRNLNDYNRTGQQYSFAKEAFGASDGADPRYVIPSANQCSVYVRGEPGPNRVYHMSGTQYLYSEGYAIPGFESQGYPGFSPLPTAGMWMESPMRPGATGDVTKTVAIEQGIFDKTIMSDGRAYPPMMPVFLKCMGNEFVVTCQKFTYRDPSAPDQSLVPVDWDFGYDPLTGLCDQNSVDGPVLSTLFGVGTGRLNGPFPDMGVYAMFGNAGL